MYGKSQTHCLEIRIPEKILRYIACTSRIVSPAAINRLICTTICICLMAYCALQRQEEGRFHRDTLRVPTQPPPWLLKK